LKIQGLSALVTGGASGLGRAVAERLIESGATVHILDLPTSLGADVALKLGKNASFSPGDVTSDDDVRRAVAEASSRSPLRILVHCAGKGGAVRLVEKDGTPGSLEKFTEVVSLNLIGTFNVLRYAAVAMSNADPIDGERGVCILTASVAAFEGQIGQIPYSASKAGIVGMTLVAARDLASKLIRVVTIAPGTFDTPLLARLSDEVRASLSESVPHPRRLGHPAEFAALAEHIVVNQMINGETIRLDGAIRMGPR